MTTDAFDHIRRSFDAQSMMRTFGASLKRIEPGRVVVEAPILPGSRQQHGFGHAGFTFANGDSAAGYSAISVLPPDREVMTTEMKINLLAPAKGELLRATGRVVKPGRRLVIVTAEVHAIEGDKETLVALLQGTMLPLDA